MSTSAATRTCPVCATTLDSVEHEGVALDRCPQGCGVWLDQGELRAVVMSEAQDRSVEEERAALASGVADYGQAVVAEASRAPRACPSCGASMRVEEYARSGVAIDTCMSHGAWLDAGELERIEAYAEGIRRQARGGAAGDRAQGVTTPVAGVDIPADLLATIRITLPPPSGSPG